MTHKMQMLDTAGGEVLVERLFDLSTDKHEMENSLVHIFQEQYRAATNASQEAADEYINAAMEAGKIAFHQIW